MEPRGLAPSLAYDRKRGLEHSRKYCTCQGYMIQLSQARYAVYIYRYLLFWGVSASSVMKLRGKLGSDARLGISWI